MNIKTATSTLSSRGDTSVFYEYNGGLSGKTSLVGFKADLELLNKRISAIQKDLTYWDLYKITTSAKTPAEAAAKISQLAIGESIVIDSATFSLGGISLSRGDTITRLIDGTLLKIPALTTGFYYPKKISVTDNIYTLTYGFTDKEPNSTAAELVKDVELEDPHVVETFKIASTGASHVYGEYVNLTENHTQITDGIYSWAYRFNIEHGDDPNNTVRPIVKFFDSSNEEVYLDFKLTADSTTWLLKTVGYTGDLWLLVK